MKKILSLVFLAVLISSACAQSFVNLNFESASGIPSGPPQGVVFLDWNLAVPGWSHSSGGDTSQVFYFSEHLGLSQYYLLMSADSPYYATNTQLAGRYSLAFASGVSNAAAGGASPSNPWINAYIAETGLISPAAMSVRMLATGPFQVFINGTLIDMQSLGGNLYGGDVAAFAGSVAELKIVNTAPVGMVHTPTVVDNVVFSPSPVPEPAAGLLVAGGLAGLAFLKRPRAGGH